MDAGDLGAARGTQDGRAFLARFPRPAVGSVAATVLSIVVGNGYLYHQIAHGALPVTGLFLLVLLETIVLGLMTWVQLARIPRSHRPEPAHRFAHAGQAIGVWIVAILSFGGAYLMWISMVGEIPVLLGYLGGLQPWVDSGIPVALAITIALGLAGALSDERHYRRYGKPYVSSLAIESSARRVLVGVGAIMIALPLAVLLLALLGGAHWLSTRAWARGLSSTRFALLALAALALFLGSFFLLAQTVDRGQLGLAGVYLLNKVLAEGAYALLPMIAHDRVATADPVAPAAVGPG